MQHRIKIAKDMDEAYEEESNEMPDIPSTITFFTHMVSFIFHRLQFEFLNATRSNLWALKQKLRLILYVNQALSALKLV